MEQVTPKTKVLLIDFNPDSIRKLKELENEFDFVSCSTIWNGGDRNLDLHGADVVFVNANYHDQSSSTVHLGDGEQVRELLQSGGLVVFFLGNPPNFSRRKLARNSYFSSAGTQPRASHQL